MKISVYGRLDFVGKPPEVDFDLVVNLESRSADAQRPRRALRLDVRVQGGKPASWQVSSQEEQTPIASSEHPGEDVKVALHRNFEFRIPLAWLLAKPTASVSVGAGGKSNYSSGDPAAPALQRGGKTVCPSMLCLLRDGLSCVC